MINDEFNFSLMIIYLNYTFEFWVTMNNFAVAMLNLFSIRYLETYLSDTRM